MWSKHIKVAALLALLQSVVMVRPLSAQEKDVEVRSSDRVASRQEGEAIAQAALRHWPQLRDKPDCSHLVHDVYTEAGLEFEYAPTNDVFDGIERFERVKNPQPGDLVVWHGHVGIVIDPEDDSFYSSVLSGFSVSSFTSSYWLSRGPRRFYRYRISDAQSAHLLSSVSYRPAGVAAAGKPRFVSPEREQSQLPPNRDLENDVPDAAMSVPARDQMMSQPRASALVISSARKPAKQDVLAALVVLSDMKAEELEQSVSSKRAVAIVDSFEVIKVETQASSGWAELKVKKIGVLADGRMKSVNTTEKMRVALTRKGGSWILADTGDNVYLLRQAAVRMISDKLAVLSRDPDSAAELKSLAKALGILLAGDRS